MVDSNRLYYLDALRLLATIGVITLHVFATDIYIPKMEYKWFISVIGDSFVRWAVPIFVMISGTLYLNPHKEVTINRMITKSIPRLLTAYAFWYIVYVIVAIVYASLLAKSFILNTDCLKPAYHLWFLPMLCGVYLLTPILRTISKEVKLQRYALVLWAGYLLLHFILAIDIPQWTSLFSINIIVGYSGYFLLGHYLSNTLLSFKKRWLIYGLGILGVIVTSAGSIAYSVDREEFDTWFLDNLTPQVALIAAAIFVFVKENAEKAGNRIRQFIHYVRKDLFGIYLVHVFWLIVFNRTFLRDSFNYAISLPLIVIIVFIFSLFTTKLLRFVPVIKKTVE